MSTITGSRKGIVLIYLTVTRCCSFPPALVLRTHRTDRRIQKMIGKIWARNSREINRRLSTTLSGRSISCADQTDSVQANLRLRQTRPHSQSSRLKSSVTGSIYRLHARRSSGTHLGEWTTLHFLPRLHHHRLGLDLCASNHKLDQIGRIN